MQRKWKPQTIKSGAFAISPSVDQINLVVDSKFLRTEDIFSVEIETSGLQDIYHGMRTRTTVSCCYRVNMNVCRVNSHASFQNQRIFIGVLDARQASAKVVGNPSSLCHKATFQQGDSCIFCKIRG